MAMSWLTRAARATPVSAFVVRGIGGGDVIAALRASAQVRLVTTPRAATVLVIAGALPASTAEALARVHDQVPAPRAVAAAGVTGDLSALGLGEVPILSPDDPIASLRTLHDDVVTGQRDRPARGPAENPVEWQGVGPHGQGGEGMMMGNPYGRPMVMPPVEGRDGLALDRLDEHLGPFLPGLPAGIVLDVGLQGDVLEEISIQTVEVGDGLAGGVVPDERRPATAQAAQALAAVAEVCALAGLDALASRTAAAAQAPTPASIAAVRRRLDRPWAVRAATDGIGVLSDGTDATARWRALLDRAAATADGDAQPAAPPVDLTALSDDLIGSEVGQALIALATLQPGLEATLVARLQPGAAGAGTSAEAHR